MRISSPRCALVVLPILVLVGCKSSESSWHKPSWSLGRLNPFSSASNTSPHPVKPSELASPTPTMSATGGYAAAGSGTTGQAGYPGTTTSYDTRSGGYPSTQGAYPSTSATSLSGSTVPGSPATTPQNGYYAPRTGYGIAGQSRSAGSASSPGSSQYSWNTGADSYSPSYGTGADNYKTADVAGPYANAAGATPRYGIASDRYGLNGSGSDRASDPSTSQSAPADPYGSLRDRSSPNTNNPQGLGAGYGGAAESGYGARTDSRYGSEFNSADSPDADSHYSAGSDSSYRYNADGSSNYASDVGDRYAQARSDSSGAGYNSYRNGQLGNSPGDSQWNPGDTGYRPGGPTDNMPGRTGYEPGNTGYNPPGVSPYRSPASPDALRPFLPGSTKLYTPRQTSLSDSPGESPSRSSVLPQTDSHVIPASHMR